MSEPFIGQITIFSFEYPPKGWAACNGQFLPISQNQALYSLLGTQFGGDGVTTFALPNLQGSYSVAQGSGFNVGQAGGEPNHTLTLAELASHTHPMVASTATSLASTPVGNFPGVPVGNAAIFASTTNTALGTGSSPAGSSQSHQNMPPFLAVNVCIALVGLFPSRT